MLLSCALVLAVNQPWKLGASVSWSLSTRRQVIDPLAWCGAMTTTMYEGWGDPFIGEEAPYWRWRQGDRKKDSGEPCLSGKHLIRLGESLSGESKALIVRNVVTRSIFLLKLHCGLEMVFAYRYHGINQPAEFASSLTYSFTLVQNPSIVPIGNCYLSQFSNRDRESGTKSPSL